MAYQRVALHHVPEAVFLRVEFALLRARALRHDSTQIAEQTVRTTKELRGLTKEIDKRLLAGSDVIALQARRHCLSLKPRSSDRVLRLTSSPRKA